MKKHHEKKITEIFNAIKRAKFYERMDFLLAQLFTWLSILTSFAATIIIASKGQVDTISIAIIAGIPGLIILIDKSFDFKTRANSGTIYKLELEELADAINYNKIKPYKAANKFIEIKRRYELEFSKIGFFAKKPWANNP